MITQAAAEGRQSLSAARSLHPSGVGRAAVRGLVVVMAAAMVVPVGARALVLNLMCILSFDRVSL